MPLFWLLHKSDAGDSTEDKIYPNSVSIFLISFPTILFYIFPSYMKGAFSFIISTACYCYCSCRSLVQQKVIKRMPDSGSQNSREDERFPNNIYVYVIFSPCISRRSWWPLKLLILCLQRFEHHHIFWCLGPYQKRLRTIINFSHNLVLS